MLNIVRQIIVYFFENDKIPTILDLEISDQDLLKNKTPLYITLYLGGEIRGSAGSINCLKDNIVEELIDLTISALMKDNRFKKVTKEEATKLNIRIDNIVNRELVRGIDEYNNINYIKDGVIVISNSHDKMAVLLPNISNNINNKDDFTNVLSKKLNETFIFEEYIVYKIYTKILSDF